MSFTDYPSPVSTVQAQKPGWQTSLLTWLATNWQILLVTLGAVILRLVLIRWAHNNYGDAVARVFLSQEWLAHPTWAPHPVWPPLPFYLTGLSLAIFRNPQVAPLIVTALLGGLTAYPIARFTTLETGKHELGLLAAILYSLLPISINLSLLTLAEVPQLFFFWVGLWLIAVYHRQGQPIGYLLGSALALNLASACRTETWLLLLPIALLYVRNVKHLLLYIGLTWIFPVIWSIYSYAQAGLLPQPVEIAQTVLRRFRPALDPGVETVELENPLSRKERLRMIAVSLPINLLSGFSPFAALLTLLGSLRALFDRRALSGLILATVSLAFVAVATYVGRWVLPTRYLLLPISLLVPYAAMGLSVLVAGFHNRWERGLALSVVLSSMLVLPYIFGWGRNLEDIRPVPRADPDQREIVNWLADHLSPDDYLVMDHIDGYLDRWVVYASRGTDDHTWITSGPNVEPGTYGNYRVTEPFTREGLYDFIRANRPRYMVVTNNGVDGLSRGKLAAELNLSQDGNPTSFPELGIVVRPVAQMKWVRIYEIDYEYK